MYKRVLKRFTNWINANYDSENELVQEKLEHTYAVLDVATKIASNENLSQEDILIAQIIAILHDCGRFPQIELFGSFKDTDEFNHAVEGARLLEIGLLKEMLPEIRQYDDIIITAVKVHGALELPKLNGRTLLHSKIIRDADRTDLYNMCIQKFDVLFWNELGEPHITPKVKQLFEKKQPIPFSELRNQLDMLVLRFGLINQYEFKSAKNLIKEENYVDRLTDIFLEKRSYYNKADVEWAREIANSFLK